MQYTDQDDVTAKSAPQITHMMDVTIPCTRTVVHKCLLVNQNRIVVKVTSLRYKVTSMRIAQATGSKGSHITVSMDPLCRLLLLRCLCELHSIYFYSLN